MQTSIQEIQERGKGEKGGEEEGRRGERREGRRVGGGRRRGVGKGRGSEGEWVRQHIQHEKE